MNEIRPGEVYTLSPLVRRMTAPNPGVMTGPGTNAYIVGNEALALIDPGPAIEDHIEALLTLVGTRLRWILCTHTHLDHSPAAAAIQRATRAQLVGMLPPQDGRHDAGFAPEWRMQDGERLQTPEFTLAAVHTPGHASNHLCYLLEEEQTLFTGDHVMQGSTVVIGPPDGSMSAYLASLRKVAALSVERFAPGHGTLIESPQEEVQRLVRHRLQRESKVCDALRALGPADVATLVGRAYDDVSPKLHPIAQRSLTAHLIKLEEEGMARRSGETWEAVEPRS